MGEADSPSIHLDYSESITKVRNNVIKMGDHNGRNAKRRGSRTTGSAVLTLHCHMNLLFGGDVSEQMLVTCNI